MDNYKDQSHELTHRWSISELSVSPLISSIQDKSTTQSTKKLHKRSCELLMILDERKEARKDGIKKYKIKSIDKKIDLRKKESFIKRSSKKKEVFITEKQINDDLEIHSRNKMNYKEILERNKFLFRTKETGKYSEKKLEQIENRAKCNKEQYIKTLERIEHNKLKKEKALRELIELNKEKYNKRELRARIYKILCNNFGEDIDNYKNVGFIDRILINELGKTDFYKVFNY